MSPSNFYKLFIIYCLLNIISCDLVDYVKTIGGYFGYKEKLHSSENGEEYSLKIPYEVSTSDEKFISEAAKLTGVALSELDSCQHRVVLKLQTDCDKLNDEQLAKMAVHLLNCQSYIEGRKIYPCTDDMAIKQCTTDMDSDTWTSYHLMSNRARAVCYSIRQVQFRGLAEHTVNKLMQASRDQLGTLKKLADDQKSIKDIAETTHDVLFEGQTVLSQQQRDLQKAQFHGQLSLEDNLRRLTDEKKLISETHNELLQMTQDVQKKLEKSVQQIEFQTGETKSNHEELIRDLIAIQKKAQSIFEKIDESSKLLVKQNEDLKKLYSSTMKNLNEVNITVHNLVTLVGGTRQALEERLAWVSSALGGTDLAVERLYLILWHIAFLLIAMIGCSFLNASYSARLVVAALPPLNLAIGLYNRLQSFDFVGLTSVLAGLIIAQNLILSAHNYYKTRPSAVMWRKKEETLPEKTKVSPLVNSENNSQDTATFVANRPSFTFRSEVVDKEIVEDENDYLNESLSNPTPPMSRNGFYNRSRSNTPASSRFNSSFKSLCCSKTRLGTPCKLTTLPGRDFCYRHQKGDSVAS